MSIAHPPIARTPIARPAALRPSMIELPMSKIGEVSQLGFGDPDVIPLWFGEGDLPTPAFICEAASAALAAGHTFYTFKGGIPPLRAALAGYLSGLHAKAVAAERVIVTSAGMGAIMLVCQTLVDPGDNVVILSPVWPNINSAVQVMGGEARPVALDATPEGGWRLDLDRLLAACDGRTKAIFVNSPGNPTGWLMSREEAAAILDFARRRGIWLLADEVYSRIVYGMRAAPSFLDLAEPEDRVIVLNSFSKNWAMTGWRLGWMVAPAEIRPVIEKLVEFNTSGAPTFLQHAAVTAVTQGEAFIAETVERCRIGRDLIIAGLQRFPRVRVVAPSGAFYAFARIEGMTDSLAFAKEVLFRAKVGVAPGIAFGAAGEGYLRLCFASSAARLEAALERLGTVLGQ